MIAGQLGEGVDPDGKPADWPAWVAEGLAQYSWPLGWGLECGHAAPNRTFPVGLPASLDGARSRLLIGA
jgi:muramoyltetrapeptide carboxypeptidase LdcA involved in peptidoglycan recycling